jgi:hypothetical protein
MAKQQQSYFFFAIAKMFYESPITLTLLNGVVLLVQNTRGQRRARMSQPTGKYDRVRREPKKE